MKTTFIPIIKLWNRETDYIFTGCPKKTWELSDEFDIVLVMI